MYSYQLTDNIYCNTVVRTCQNILNAYCTSKLYVPFLYLSVLLSELQCNALKGKKILKRAVDCAYRNCQDSRIHDATIVRLYIPVVPLFGTVLVLYLCLSVLMVVERGKGSVIISCRCNK